MKLVDISASRGASVWVIECRDYRAFDQVGPHGAAFGFAMAMRQGSAMVEIGYDSQGKSDDHGCDTDDPSLSSS